MKKTFFLIALILLFTTSVSATPIANFTYTITGSNITCTSTSTDTTNISYYSWNVTVNTSEVGTTGWVEDLTTYTYTFPHGQTQVLITLCVKNGSYINCKTKSMGIVSGNKDNYPPEKYITCKTCEDAGYYWYNDQCNKKPEILPWNVQEPLPSAGEHEQEELELFGYTINPGLLAILFILVVIILVSNSRRGKKR